VIDEGAAGVPSRQMGQPHLECRIQVNQRKAGFMSSGMRCPAWFDRQRTADGALLVHDVVVYFEGGASTNVGESGAALVYPFHPELWPDLPPGATFELWEGKPFADVVVVEPLVGTKPS
jgi:hypothetical protein